MNDDNLKKWQIRQIEKCHIENTINNIIEICSLIQGEFPPSNILQFYEHQNSYNFEESAILMAIHAYGLQQTTDNNISLPTSPLLLTDEQQHQRQHQSEQEQHQQLRLSCTSSLTEMNTITNPIIAVNCSNNSNTSANMENQMDMSNLMETAVSVAIQKQGLGLLEPNR